MGSSGKAYWHSGGPAKLGDARVRILVFEGHPACFRTFGGQRDEKNDKAYTLTRSLQGAPTSNLRTCKGRIVSVRPDDQHSRDTVCSCVDPGISTPSLEEVAGRDTSFTVRSRDLPGYDQRKSPPPPPPPLSRGRTG